MSSVVVFLVSLFAFGISAAVSAVAPPAVRWVKGYSNGNSCEAHPHAGVQAADGGILMVGDSVCDNTRTVDRYVFVVKTDDNGNELWSTPIGDIGYNYGKYGIQLSDRNFVVAGSKSVADANAKYGYIEHRALFVLSNQNGSVLSQQVFANYHSAENLRDGFMCINAVHGEQNGYVTTGYMGGEAGNDDEPMFLIFGGFAFLMKVTYNPGTFQFQTEFEVVFNSTNIVRTLVPMQGMRVFDDYQNRRFSLSAATHPPTDYNVQFGMVSADYTGRYLWSNIYPAARSGAGGSASHPYALTLSSENDGYVIAGLAIQTGHPWGRMTKIAAADGQLQWDQRFRNPGPANMNTECYGISVATDHGYIVTCGTGIGSGTTPAQTWMALLHRTDVDGNQDWQQCYTNQSQALNNAGEYVITLNDGGYAMYIDSSAWGSQTTGGNFALMRLYSDD